MAVERSWCELLEEAVDNEQQQTAGVWANTVPASSNW